MAYTKLTDFAVKDALLTGNPAKVVRGTEIDAELNAIAAADALNLSAASIVAATSKPTPIDADLLPLVDSAASNVLKKLTWANLKATLLTWLQGTVLPSPGPIGSTTPSTGAFTTLSASGIVSAPASISLTNAGLATQAHIGGNGSGRVLVNAIAGQEVDLQVAGATILYASGTAVGTTVPLSVTGGMSTTGDLTLQSAGTRVTGATTTGNTGIQNSGGTAYLLNFGSAHATEPHNVWINSTGGSVKIKNATSDVAVVSSTGVAVTGVLSATGNITTNSNVTFSGVGAVTQAAQNAYTRVIGGTTANVDPTVTLYGSTHANAGLATYDAATHRFRSSTGTEYARIDASGNLGIGTATPNTALDVASAASDAVLSLTATGVQRWQLKTERSTGNFLLYNQTGATTPITVSTAGNLGIGSAPGAFKLDVTSTADQLRLVNSTGNAERLIASTNASGTVFSSYNTAATTIPFVWKGYTTELMRLDASGNLGLGVTPIASTAKIQSKEATASSVGGLSSFAGFQANAAGHFTKLTLGTDTGSGLAGVAAKAITYGAGGAYPNNVGSLIGFTQNLGSTITCFETQAGSSFALEGATLSTGVGIAFPATQLASSNANTLDDYEEGTFTPTIVGTTTAGTGTYTAQSGSYTKIGREVTCHIYLNWSAHTGTGNLAIASLPFAASGAANTYYSASIGDVSNITLTASNIMTAYVGPGNTQMVVKQTPVGGGASSSILMDTSGFILLTIAYEV